MGSSEPIVVVGASIAGLHAAHRIAAAGREVVVLERMRALDAQPRSLIVTSTMRDILGAAGEPSITNEVRGYELVVGAERLTGRFARPDLIIERAALIRSLAKRATEAGARIEHGARVTGISTQAAAPGVRVAAPDGERRVRARTVIVANGAVGDLVGIRQPLAPLVQAIVDRPADLAPDRFRVWFRPQDTPYFLWMIPEGPDRAGLGIIGDGRTGTRQVLDRFIAEHGFQVHGYQGARIPIYARWIEPRRMIGSTEVLLAGDAAGHVKVSTVGGVVTGLRGAEAAAASALRAPDAAKRWRALRAELGAHLLARRVVHPMSEREYARLFAASAPALDALGAVDRDHAVRLMAGALARHPGLFARSLIDLARSRRFVPR